MALKISSGLHKSKTTIDNKIFYNNLSAKINLKTDMESHVYLCRLTLLHRNSAESNTCLIIVIFELFYDVQV